MNLVNAIAFGAHDCSIGGKSARSMQADRLPAHPEVLSQVLALLLEAASPWQLSNESNSA